MSECKHPSWLKSIIPWGSCQDCGIDAEVWIKSEMERLTKERDRAMAVVEAAKKIVQGYDGPTVDAATAVSSHVARLSRALAEFDKEVAK